MTKKQKLIEAATVEAKKTGHVILIGHSVFEDARSGMSLFDSGSSRKAWRKWNQQVKFSLAVGPDGTIYE